ncbi:hypothetical protein ABPG72_016180 [Tetrahymena utriculariae]
MEDLNQQNLFRIESSEKDKIINTSKDLEPLFQMLFNVPSLMLKIYVSKYNSENISAESFKLEKYHILKIKFKEAGIQQQDIQDFTQNLFKLKNLNDLTLDLVLNNLSGLSGNYLSEGLSQLTNLQNLIIDLGNFSLAMKEQLNQLKNWKNLLTQQPQVYQFRATQLGISLSKLMNLKFLNLDLSGNDHEHDYDLKRPLLKSYSLINFMLIKYF